MRPFPVVPAFGVDDAAVGEGEEEVPRGVCDVDEVVDEEEISAWMSFDLNPAMVRGEGILESLELVTPGAVPSP